VYRRLIAAVVLSLAAAACAAGGDASDTAQPASPASPEGGAPASPPAAGPPGAESVTVLAVLDGDSIAVERDERRTEVRLAGINAPEADECHGDVSRTMLEGLIGDAEAILVAVAGEDDTDQFGRLLRNVWVGDTWLNETLVRRGAALAVQAGSPSEADLVAAEEDAWGDGAGMWAPDACGDVPPGVQVTEVSYDPPGSDRENAAEEFVLLRNDGTEPVDLSGWIVRDESSQHRYRFPEGTVLAPGEGIRLRSGCGSDDGLDRYWCAGDAVWSNRGDTVLLQTPAGTVASRYKYAGRS
jgi:micrococcal nuclease